VKVKDFDMNAVIDAKCRQLERDLFERNKPKLELCQFKPLKTQEDDGYQKYIDHQMHLMVKYIPRQWLLMNGDLI